MNIAVIGINHNLSPISIRVSLLQILKNRSN